MDFIVFCDFDGTITTTDLIDILVLNKYDQQIISEYDNKIMNNEIDHDDVLKKLFDNISISFNDAINIINEKTNKKVIDEYFMDFYYYCQDNNIKIYIISGGFKKIINYFLPHVDSKFIFANDIDIDTNNKWNINFISSNGLDKVKFINKLSNSFQKKIYIGDGISDIKVIDAIDYLYVKDNSFLYYYCKNNNIKMKSFSNFKTIINDITNFYDIHLPNQYK